MKVFALETVDFGSASGLGGPKMRVFALETVNRGLGAGQGKLFIVQMINFGAARRSDGCRAGVL